MSRVKSPVTSWQELLDKIEIWFALIKLSGTYLWLAKDLWSWRDNREKIETTHEKMSFFSPDPHYNSLTAVLWTETEGKRHIRVGCRVPIFMYNWWCFKCLICVMLPNEQVSLIRMTGLMCSAATQQLQSPRGDGSNGWHFALITIWAQYRSMALFPVRGHR